MQLLSSKRNLVGVAFHLMDAVKNSLDVLYSYCKSQNWMGFDPFDGLSSKIFQFSFFKHSRSCRLFFLQLNKLMVPKK